MTASTRLEMSRDLRTYRLVEPKLPGAFEEPSDEEWSVTPHGMKALESNLDQQITATNDALARQRPSGDCGLVALRIAGTALHKGLLPPSDNSIADLRQRLEELATPLSIRTYPGAPPIELAYDEKRGDFLGLSYDLGRQLALTGARKSSRAAVGEPRCLIVADPNNGEEGLGRPDAETEGAAVKKMLEARGVVCDVLGGGGILDAPAATCQAVVAKLAGVAYHVIHYAGHIVLDERTGQYAWQLRDELLPAGIFQSQLQGRPLVFLNGCDSASNRADNVAFVEAMTDSMLIGGASVVIGSIYPLPARGARSFAERFYGALLDGEPLGAAMRAARVAAREDPANGAAWASYVLYGDPCLKLEFVDDDLARLLGTIGAKRADFDLGALKVLELALEHCRPVRQLSTAHLFAALVAGPDRTLYERLETLDAGADKLSRGFDALFQMTKQLGDDSEDPVAFSPNAGAIVAKAVTERGDAAVTEEQLLASFVLHGQGSSTHQILAALDVDAADLLPGGSGAPTRVEGPREGDVLSSARQIAARSGANGVDSVHLFRALLGCEPSLLAQSLRRLGVSERLLEPLWAPSDPDELPLSESVEKIHLLARAGAHSEGRDKPEERDLLAAFVEHGGGQVGAWLRHMGVPFAAITSALFDERGDLVRERFAGDAWTALDEAIGCAKSKDHEGLTRLHLLYGLLRIEGSLTRAIREDGDAGRHPDDLADLLHGKLPKGSGHPDARRIASLARMSHGLVDALCAADCLRREAREELVAEPHLARGLLGDGGDGAGMFLRENGLNVRRLLG
jgi:hypothetical protein